MIIEPLVQGAAGMLMHPPGYLRAVRELCDAPRRAADLRRGGHRLRPHRAMFACEHEGVAPDLLCLGKGITGGYLPLAATLASEAIYEGFLGEHEEFRTFFHGHTYTGNPLACAAAIATLDVFSDERTLERLQRKIELFGELLEPVAAHPEVREVRQRGFMVGIELAEHPLPVSASATASRSRRAAAARSSARSATWSC